MEIFYVFITNVSHLRPHLKYIIRLHYLMKVYN